MYDEGLARRCREALIIGEGFSTYCGLAGRDLEAIAIGLREVLDEEYLQYRIRSVEYSRRWAAQGGCAFRGASGRARDLCGRKAPASAYLASRVSGAGGELYLAGGIRGVEIGSLMFGKRRNGVFEPAAMELVRLAVPRRVYTQSHIDYVIEVFADIARRPRSIHGLKLIEASEHLSHFTARLAPLE